MKAPHLCEAPSALTLVDLPWLPHLTRKLQDIVGLIGLINLIGVIDEHLKLMESSGRVPVARVSIQLNLTGAITWF